MKKNIENNEKKPNLRFLYGFTYLYLLIFIGFLIWFAYVFNK